jgi:hypothetical protein
MQECFALKMEIFVVAIMSQNPISKMATVEEQKPLT